MSKNYHIITPAILCRHLIEAGRSDLFVVVSMHRWKAAQQKPQLICRKLPQSNHANHIHSSLSKTEHLTMRTQILDIWNFYYKKTTSKGISQTLTRSKGVKYCSYSASPIWYIQAQHAAGVWRAYSNIFQSLSCVFGASSSADMFQALLQLNKKQLIETSNARCIASASYDNNNSRKGALATCTKLTQDLLQIICATL